MRKRNQLTAVLAALLLVVVVSSCVSCATATPATVSYRTIASVKLAVDTGMQVWADRVIDGKTTPAQEAQVKAAFQKYTAAAGAAAAIMRASTDPAPPDFTGAADALLNLLAAFGVNVKGGV